MKWKKVNAEDLPKGKVLVLNEDMVLMSFASLWTNDRKDAYFDNPDEIHSAVKATHYIPRRDILSLEIE